MLDRLLKTTNPKASTVKPASKQVQMGSLDGVSTPVKDFNTAIQAYLEKCPPETDWFKRGSKLYAITTDDTLDLASQLRSLNEAINSWPKTTDMALEKLITQLSTNIFDYYDSQTKPQTEPSTPERKNSLDANSDSYETSVGSSLSSSPEDAASVSAEPAVKQEVLDYNKAIAKFNKACVKHSPDWLPKALALYNVLSNDNLIDDASKYDALIKEIEAWGKVNNSKLAIAIVQLESDLKAFYETKRISKPFFQRTNSLDAGLSDASASSTDSSSSPDKSPKSQRKPRKTRVIHLDGTNTGEATKTSIKTNTPQTINTPAQPSSASASSPTELQSNPPTTVQPRPGTPIPFMKELPFAEDVEQKSEEITDNSERSASPSSDSTASASSGSAISSPSLTPSKSSPNVSPKRERLDQQGLPEASSIADVKGPLTPRAATPEQQAPMATSTYAEPLKSATPQRQPSPALETEAVATVTTPATNRELIESRKQRWEVPKTLKKDIQVEDEKLSLRQNIETLTAKVASLEQDISQLNSELIKKNNETPTKEAFFNQAKSTYQKHLRGSIEVINQKVESAEEAVKDRYEIGRSWGDFIHSIPLIKSIPFIKRARERRETALAKKLSDLRTNRMDLYTSQTLLTNANNQTPEAFLSALDKFRNNRPEKSEHKNEDGGMDIFIVHGVLKTFCDAKKQLDTHLESVKYSSSRIFDKECELSECKAAREKLLQQFTGQAATVAKDDNSFVQSVITPSLARR